MEVLQKTKNRIAVWSWNAPPGHISEWHYDSKRYMHLSVQRSTIYNSQDMETTYMSIDGWMEKMWCIHTTEHSSVIKKDKILQFTATWIDLKIIIQSEVSRNRKTNIWYNLYVESKIWHKWSYLWYRNRLLVVGEW